MSLALVIERRQYTCSYQLHVQNSVSAILSIILDLVTDNQALLGDPLYLGLRQQRSSEAEMEEFIDEFFMEMALMFPRHWCKLEDFSSGRAFSYSSRFCPRLPLIDDDVQCIGAVVLAGLLSAALLLPLAPKDRWFLFYGTDSDGVGVAKQVLGFFYVQQVECRRGAEPYLARRLQRYPVSRA